MVTFLSKLNTKGPKPFSLLRYPTFAYFITSRTRLRILGGGVVGQTLSRVCVKKGYTVVLGSEHISEAWQELHPKIKVVSYDVAASEADFIILALPGRKAEAVVKAVLEPLDETIVLDVTNPIDTPRGQHTTLFPLPQGISLMEHLQTLAPKVNFVKSLNYVASTMMAEPKLEIKLDEGDASGPTMFFCGDDVDAKESVKYLLADLGWNPVDAGPATAARMLEHLSMLRYIRQQISGSEKFALQLLNM